MKFLISNNILYTHQYGFRAKHSTIHPILHLLNQCAESSNANPPRFTLATFCDLSKAFDTISTDILLHKLHTYGIRGKANEWIKSYLTDRSQFVDFDSHISPKLQLKCGVPQGSILGPLLFLIYINDINYSTAERILSFADDTTVILSDHDPIKLYARANTCLREIFNWFCANKLSLNASKTQYMIIQPNGTSRHNIDYDLKINGVTLSRTNSCKFLGIIIDESLSWKQHLSSVNKKLSHALFGIKQLKFFLPKESLRILYFSLIHSHLSYGLLAWGNSNGTAMRKLETIQKRAIRSIYNKKYNSHTDPLFKQSGILKIPDMYQLQVMLFMHDYIIDKLPMSFRHMYEFNSAVQSVYSTRQSQLFNIPRTKSRFVDKLPFIQFPITWNKLAGFLGLNSDLLNLSRNALKCQLKYRFTDSYQSNVTCNNPRCNDCR